MNHFKNIARQLSLAIRHKKTVSISFWGNKKWEDLFEEEPGGIGAIKPAVAASLFSASALDALTGGQGSLDAFTPPEVENKLCEKYIDYKNKGFWRRLWMIITQPIDIYRQAYTIITLRDLQKQYVAIGETASQLSGISFANIDKWNDYFSEAIAGLSACLRSYLPTDVGFFSRFFQREAMYSHVLELQQFKTDISAVLRDQIESSYVEFLKKVQSCSSDKQKERLREEMKHWFEVHANSINANKKGLNQSWEGGYDSLLNTLNIKYKLLLCLVKTGNPVEQVTLDAGEYQYVDKKYEHLSDKLKNLEQGCAVQIDDMTCVYSHTYVVRRNFFWQWEVRYAATPEGSLSQVDISNFPGLETVLEHNPDDTNAIKQAIISGHQNGISLNKDYGTDWCEEVLATSPDKQDQILLMDYSRQLEAGLLRQQTLKDNDLQAAVEKLQAYRQYVAQKNESRARKHQELQNHSKTYRELSEACLKEAAATKIQYMDLMVFDSETQNRDAVSGACIRKLTTRYDTLYTRESFLQLPATLQNALKKEAAEHIASIERLMPVFQAIHAPTFKDKVRDFFGEYSSAVWMGDIEDYFKQALVGSSTTNYIGTLQKLQNIARACFQRYVLQVPCNLWELRAIHVKIEKVRQEHVHSIQQQTRTLVVLPPDEKSAVMPHQFLMDTLMTYPSRMEYIVHSWLKDFEAALKMPFQYTDCFWITMTKKPTLETLKTLPVVFNPAYIYVNEPLQGKSLYFVNKDTSLIEEIRLTTPVSQCLDTEFALQVPGSRLSQEQAIRIMTLTNHSYDRRIYLYNILLESLVYRLEGILWGLLDSKIFFYDECGLMRASKEQVERIMQKLPYSHYIITPNNELFYYCKYENTLELHALLNPEQQDMFKKDFPGNNHGYYPWLYSFQTDQISNAIMHDRDEERKITTKKACEMTRKEITQLFRAISLFYHSDKHPDSEALQKLIGSKKAAAEARIDEIVWLQEHLITKYNLLRENLPRVPLAVGVLVPDWIEKHIEVDVAAQRYCNYLRSDEVIERRNSRSRAFNERMLNTQALERTQDEMMAKLILMQKDLEDLNATLNKLCSELPIKPKSESGVLKGAEQSRFFNTKSDESRDYSEKGSDDYTEDSDRSTVSFG